MNWIYSLADCSIPLTRRACELIAEARLKFEAEMFLVVWSRDCSPRPGGSLGTAILEKDGELFD